MTKNIMIAGVGGRGTLLAGRILGNLFVKCGYEVKVSKVHGMSQRGGSVVTYVKYGGRVYSPVIENGEADIILAFELLEAYRAVPYLKKDGIIIANTQRINPMPVITGTQTVEKVQKSLDFFDSLKFIHICISHKNKSARFFAVSAFRHLSLHLLYHKHPEESVV